MEIDNKRGLSFGRHGQKHRRHARVGRYRSTSESRTRNLRLRFSMFADIVCVINACIIIIIIKQNWNQFLLVVKATALKQQISNFFIRTFNAQMLAITFMPVTGLS